MELTSLDVRYVARELATMEGAKVEKVFQSKTDRKDILLVLYQKERPKLYLRMVPGMVCLQEEKPAYPQVPPAFAMFLRKYMKSARVKTVEQQGFDRIFVFTFTRGDGESQLIVELIPPGNVLFLQEGKVRNLVETQRYKDRTLRGGIQYEPPPAAFDIIEASDLELIDKLKTTTRKDIATALAMTLGLGGVYAEEVCARADIDKSRSDLKSGELKSIVKALREIQNAEISPHVSEKRVFPFKPVSVSTSPVEGSFLQALSRFVDAPSDGKETKQGSAKKDKAAAIVKSQKKRIRQLEEEFPKEQEKAEKIYEEYMLMKDILDTVRTAREKKQDIEKALSKYKQVKAYHPKNAQIEVELD